VNRVGSCDRLRASSRKCGNAQDHKMAICRDFHGSDGTQPATSGVTGRHGTTGCDRLRPGITGYSSHFVEWRTGCDRLRPAGARQSLCGRCVVALVPLSTTVRMTVECAAR
jgi:hypothetical protein